MDDVIALKRLNMLLAEGALKDATPFHLCAPIDPDQRPAGVIDDMVAADPKLAKACASWGKEQGHTPGRAGGYTSLGHYHLATMKRIEPSENRPGWYICYADDDLGTTRSGTPSALLARLTEHERE